MDFKTIEFSYKLFLWGLFGFVCFIISRLLVQIAAESLDIED